MNSFSNFRSNLTLLISTASKPATDSAAEMASQESPIPRPADRLSSYEQILSDPSLAKGMHPPDYFLLVE